MDLLEKAVKRILETEYFTEQDMKVAA
jgi:hypothetical protein